MRKQSGSRQRRKNDRGKTFGNEPKSRNDSGRNVISAEKSKGLVSSTILKTGQRLVAMWRSVPSRKLAALATTIGAMALALAQFTSAIDTISGGVSDSINFFREEPSPSPTPPADLTANISDVQFLERNKMLVEVYRDRGLTPDRTLYGPQQLSTPGQLLRFHCTFGGGFVGRDLRVKWTLYDNVQQQAVRDGTWRTVNADGWPSPGWRVEATEKDFAEGELWVPNVRVGEFKVLIRLVDDHQTEVASAWSDTYAVETLPVSRTEFRGTIKFQAREGLACRLHGRRETCVAG